MNRLYCRCISLLLILGLYLGQFHGYVALWDEDRPDPRIIYPYKTAALPPADQAALEQGIPVRSEKELQRLLEDFLS